MAFDNRSVVLEIAGLSVQRGKTVILENVCWRIKPGEQWVLLGPNGSGKTSLLAALTAYMTPSKGEIRLLGRRYGRADWRELRKEVGLVSSSIRQMMPEDEPAIETIASGKHGMIDFWGKIGAGERAAAATILKQIECTYLAERPWAVLSQGERQRVLIGRALMAEPKLLILDEPCAGLDPAAREHFLDFLQRCGKRPGGPALVLVTHHVEEIVPVFSHVMLLKEGRVRASGRKATVLTSELLSDTFGARMRLMKERGRYRLRVAPVKGGIV